jgi:hypothetical protein
VVIWETKRKRHIESREMPLFRELRPFLETCFRAKDRDPIKVVKRVRCTKNNLRTQMGRILERAKIKQWPKLFQNLRSTRETELVIRFMWCVPGWGIRRKWRKRTTCKSLTRTFRGRCSDVFPSSEPDSLGLPADPRPPGRVPRKTAGWFYFSHRSLRLPQRLPDCFIIQARDGDDLGR